MYWKLPHQETPLLALIPLRVRQAEKMEAKSLCGKTPSCMAPWGSVQGADYSLLPYSVIISLNLHGTFPT